MPPRHSCQKVRWQTVVYRIVFNRCDFEKGVFENNAGQKVPNKTENFFDFCFTLHPFYLSFFVAVMEDNTEKWEQKIVILFLLSLYFFLSFQISYHDRDLRRIWSDERSNRCEKIKIKTQFLRFVKSVGIH